MPYGRIHFCMNWMSTSCWSVHLSVACITNFRPSFLEILAHSFLWHAIWWDPLSYESDLNFLLIRAFVCRVYNSVLTWEKYIHIRAGVFLASIGSQTSCDHCVLSINSTVLNFWNTTQVGTKFLKRGCKEWGRIWRLKSPTLRHSILKFSRTKQNCSIVKNEKSVISTTPY
jgi:hypothetical protein